MSKTCPAGGKHVQQTYNTEQWGIFVACNKCGVRTENACPVTKNDHHPETKFVINPDTGKPEVRDVCKACNTRL